MTNKRIQKKESVKFAEGVWRFTLENILTGKKRVYEYCNLIPTVGRAQIAKALEGGIASVNEIKINYTSLGTGVTAPQNSDTQLETESYRKGIASATHANNVLYCTAFYTAVETTGAFKEAGLHINGTGAPNSGVLFSRVAIDITKSNLDTLTVDYTITFN